MASPRAASPSAQVTDRWTDAAQTQTPLLAHPHTATPADAARLLQLKRLSKWPGFRQSSRLPKRAIERRQKTEKSPEVSESFVASAAASLPLLAPRSHLRQMSTNAASAGGAAAAAPPPLLRPRRGSKGGSQAQGRRSAGARAANWSRAALLEKN